MHLITDTARGDWLRERVGRVLRGDWSVPGGYPAAVRVLHEPALVRDLGTTDSLLRITWGQAATLLGLRVEQGMSWADLTGSDEDATPLAEGLALSPPEQGRLPPATLAALLRVLAPSGGPATAAVWVGWAELQPPSAADRVGFVVTGDRDPEEVAAAIATRRAEIAARIAAEPLTAVQEAIRDGHVLRLPAREYALLDCDLAELLDPAWVRTPGLGWTPRDDLPDARGPVSPALLWPEDRSWVLTTEVDDPWTTVVGPDALIEALHRLPGVETVRVPAPRSR